MAETIVQESRWQASHAMAVQMQPCRILLDMLMKLYEEE